MIWGYHDFFGNTHVPSYSHQFRISSLFFLSQQSPQIYNPEVKDDKKIQNDSEVFVMGI